MIEGAPKLEGQDSGVKNESLKETLKRAVFPTLVVTGIGTTAILIGKASEDARRKAEEFVPDHYLFATAVNAESAAMNLSSAIFQLRNADFSDRAALQLKINKLQAAASNSISQTEALLQATKKSTE